MAIVQLHNLQNPDMIVLAKLTCYPNEKIMKIGISKLSGSIINSSTSLSCISQRVKPLVFPQLKCLGVNNIDRKYWFEDLPVYFLDPTNGYMLSQGLFGQFLYEIIHEVCVTDDLTWTGTFRTGDYISLSGFNVSEFNSTFVVVKSYPSSVIISSEHALTIPTTMGKIPRRTYNLFVNSALKLLPDPPADLTIADANVTLNVETLEIPWQPNETYTIEVEDNFVYDKYGQNYSNPPFSTTFHSNPPLTIISSVPSNGDIATNTNDYFELEFGRKIYPNNSGNFYLYKDNPESIVKIFPLDWDIIKNTKIVLDVRGLIEPSSTYYIMSDSNIIRDGDNFFFTGLSNTTDLRFTTVNEEYFKDLISIQTSFGSIGLSYKRFRSFIVASAAISSVGIASKVNKPNKSNMLSSFTSVMGVGKKQITGSTLNSAFIQSSVVLRIKQFTSNMIANSSAFGIGIHAKIFEASLSSNSNLVSTATEIPLVSKATVNVLGVMKIRNTSSMEISQASLSCIVDLSRYVEGVQYYIDTPSINNTPVSIGQSNRYTSINNRYIYTASPTAISSSGTTGVVYAFDLITGKFAFEIINPLANDFGQSLDCTDTHIIIGSSTGVRIYTADGQVVRSHYSAESSYGLSVAINSNYYYIGIPQKTNIGIRDGSVEVRSLSTGNLITTKTRTGTASALANTNFGWDIYCSDSHLLIRTLETSNVTSKIYRYNVDGTGGTYFIASPDGNVNFANSASISGNYAILNDISSNNSYSGIVRVYNLTTGLLSYTINNPNIYNTINDDKFGQSVSSNSTHIIIGAPGEDPNGKGVCYLFDLSNGQLVYTFQPVRPNTGGNTYQLGVSAVMTDSDIAIGQAGDFNEYSGNYGSFFVYRF